MALRKTKSTKTAAPEMELPQVSVSEDETSRYLHLGTPWVQGSMRLKDPFALDLEYVQRMMAWLLFTDSLALEDLQHQHAVQLGLGAAALTKFHHHSLGMPTTAIEINPLVVHICRTWFKLPPDGERLQVLQGDAAELIQLPCWRGAVHALQVDLYDHEAAAPVLDSAQFYADCHAMLAPEGCMTVNLFGRRSSYAQSVEKICAAFGSAGQVWAFRPTREGNTIVLARRQADTTPSAAQLHARAQEIEQRFKLPARKWLKIFGPVASLASLPAAD